MRKNFIWLLIATMAVSLIGIIMIQSRWIKWSINLNEEKFNREVGSALNNVEKDLTASENAVDIDILSSDLLEGQGTTSSRLDFYYRKGKLEDSTLISDDLRGLISGTRKNFKERLSLLEGLQVNRLLRLRDIEDRINIDKLSFYIKKHLTKRDIDIRYDYGVWSTKHESFVILNDNFVVEEEGQQFSNTGINEGLLKSPYKINLFETEEGVPGILYLDFPDRNRILFRDVWPTIIGSIFFTGIILFCFAYTIQVIVRQKKLSEMRTDFINNMTHEFKTPIATINLAADSITSPMIAGNSDKVGRFAQIIKQENGRMLNQVEKVLQMALLEKKDFKLKMTEINVHELIVQAVEHANLKVASKGGMVKAELAAKNPNIMADQTHISNIIHNLLDNANKYSPERPDIQVSTQNVNGGVQIRVEDKGIGMTKDQKKHIFDKFYRVHTGNRHDVKGFGLGLSYVKAMVAAHKGNITVQSELGEGSSFVVQLPFDGGQEKNKNGVSKS